MSIEIYFERTTFLEKFELSHKLCKSYIIRKEYYILFHIINQMDFFKYATQKGELSYSDIAKGDKIVEILERAKYIFGFTDDKTDITEIYLFKKSLKCFYSSKNLLLN